MIDPDQLAAQMQQMQRTIDDINRSLRTIERHLGIERTPTPPDAAAAARYPKQRAKPPSDPDVLKK